jgi:hypothetical protein
LKDPNSSAAPTMAIITPFQSRNQDLVVVEDSSSKVNVFFQFVDGKVSIGTVMLLAIRKLVPPSQAHSLRMHYYAICANFVIYRHSASGWILILIFSLSSRLLCLTKPRRTAQHVEALRCCGRSEISFSFGTESLSMMTLV